MALPGHYAAVRKRERQCFTDRAEGRCGGEGQHPGHSVRFHYVHILRQLSIRRAAAGWLGLAT